MDKELTRDQGFREAGSASNNGVASDESTDTGDVAAALKLMMSHMMRSFDGVIDRASRLVDQIVSPVTHAVNLGNALGKNGWFPHHTMPKEILAENQENPELGEILIDYYRRNWDSVRLVIEKQLDAYLVDDEAKAIFRECLVAHEKGLYRLVCRSSFPEVERVVRVEIIGNRVGHLPVEKLMRERFGGLPISVFSDGLLDIAGYLRINNILYEQVKSEDDRQRFVGHQIPNRHASIHGLIPYSSAQTSLNSLFFVDCVFRLITKLKSFERDAVLRT